MLLLPLNNASLSVVVPDLEYEIVRVRSDRNFLALATASAGVMVAISSFLLLGPLLQPTVSLSVFAGGRRLFIDMLVLGGLVCASAICTWRIMQIAYFANKHLRHLRLASLAIKNRGSALSRAVQEWNRRAAELEADVGAMDADASHDEREEQFKRAALLLETRGVIEQEADRFRSLAPRIASQATST